MRKDREAGEGEESLDGFTPEERAAMRERARELRAARRGSPADDEAGAPRLWYGMPAYAKDGKVLCYFTPAAKFKERCATFGFNAVANLDEGNMRPTAFALKELTVPEEARIVELVRRAVS